MFLFCGQMIARKGVDLAARRLRAARNAADCCSSAAKRNCPRCSHRCHRRSRERITYAGFQPPEELPRFFAEADVFVLPSRYDGWGVVVNQALGAGLPILCSDRVGAGADLVEDEANGLALRRRRRRGAGRGACDRCLDAAARNSKRGAASRARRAAEWTPAAGAAKWIARFQRARHCCENPPRQHQLRFARRRRALPALPRPRAARARTRGLALAFRRIRRMDELAAGFAAIGEVIRADYTQHLRPAPAVRSRAGSIAAPRPASPSNGARSRRT